jgi:ABC-type uncharacterized transport system involved in gliding motility auxiliary subunit
MSWSRQTIATTSIVLAVILFFAVNILFNSLFKSARLDLTQQGSYSISDGTVRTLRAIQEPITLRLFFSEAISSSYPSLRAYGQRVRDVLQQYATISGGKVKVEVIDPVPFSEAEDQAVAAGMRGAPIPSGERVYFGLSGTNTIDGRESIPVFLEEREKFLEYDLTALVHRLTREKRPMVGVVTNLPLDTGLGGLEAAMQGQSQPFYIYEQLRLDFATQFLEQDFDRVPKDVDVLLIVHPKPLNARTLYAIDQFVMRGGRVFALLDPLSELSQMRGPTGQPLQGSTPSSAESLGKVLDSWGVAVDPKFVIADQALAQRVQTGGGGDGMADYVLWLSFQAANMDPKDRVTANLQSLNLGTVGAISKLEKATTTVTPLVRTSPVTMEIGVEKATNNPDPDELTRTFLSANERFDVGVRISGPVKSAFPDGPPKESLEQRPVAEGAPKPEPLPAHLKEAKEANIVLLADSDVFNDNFWVQLQQIAGERIAAREIAGNRAFVVNAVEDLTGSNDLISLRSRGDSIRPFTAVDAIRKRAEAKWLREKELLETKLNEAAEKLAQLQGQRPDREPNAADDGTLSFTPEQRAEIERFRAEYNSTKRQLRDVQLNLNRDIDNLKGWLAAFNIAFVPILMTIGLIVWGWMRAQKRKSLAAAKAATG